MRIMPPSTSPPRLKRDLGLLEAVGVGLGAIIGAGIFVVTGLAAGAAGPAFLVSLAMAGAAAACNAYSAAQLAMVFPRAGGAYEFGRRLLHPLAGHAAGWLFICSKTAAGAAVALGFGGYLASVVPGIPVRLTALGAVAALTAANLIGIRKSGLLNTVIVTITISVLITLTLACAPSFDSARLRPFAPGGIGGIFEAAALLFFAYTGYARVATLSEEVRNPRVTIPRAMTVTLIVAFGLYAAVGLATLGALGAERMAATGAPLAEAARAAGPPWLPGLVTFAAATAMLGVLLSQIMGVSRTVYAMARQNDLPHALARVSPSRRVPSLAIAATAAAMAVLTAAGGLASAVSVAAFTILAYYIVMNAAALRLLSRPKHGGRCWIPICGLISCAVLLCSLPAATLVAGLCLIAVGLLLRPLFRGRSRQA